MNHCDSGPVRFVILRHVMPPRATRGDHWDLMLEGPDALHTWALQEEPRLDTVQVARRLPDHRKAYLDYEGPISGDRGSVTRWDRGTCQLGRPSDLVWFARLDGQRLRCRVRLERIVPAGNPARGNSACGDSARGDSARDDQRWTCRFLPPEVEETC